MQLHELKPTRKAIKSKRIGRGGKRGTFSGRGSKGQKSRAGTRIRPGFRGGNEPLWKLFPKQRGATKKTNIKKTRFQVRRAKIPTINLKVLEARFNDGDKIDAKVLVEKGLIRSYNRGVKILGSGNLNKNLVFGEDVKFSKSVYEKVH